MSTEPRWASTLGAMKLTVAGKGRAGKASATHIAGWPRARTSRFFSSTGTSSSVSPARAISNSTRPGCTRSPGSTLRVSTVPGTSARIVVFSRRAWAVACRARAAASAGPPSARSCIASRACSAAVRATVSACSACSSASRAISWRANRSRRRAASRLACSSRASASRTAACARGRVERRSWSRAAVASAAWASRSSARSTASTSPGCTASPSCTRRSSTTPVTGLPTWARETATTRPVATTVCTSGRAVTS